MLTACNAAPTAKSKMATKGPKMATECTSRLLGILNSFREKSFLKNMKKVRDGKLRKKMRKIKKMMEIVATNAVASRPPNIDRLQRRQLVPI